MPKLITNVAVLTSSEKKIVSAGDYETLITIGVT